MVTEIYGDEENKGYTKYLALNDYVLNIENDDIETVLTHEMYELNKYKAGDD